MKFRGKWSKGFIAFIVRNYIRKVCGIDATIRFPGNIELTIDDGAHLSFDVEADISKEDLAKLKQIIGF